MLFSAGTPFPEFTPGSPAPDFNLVDQFAWPHTLKDHQGKWLVLYFYPKDNTPGCTKEACNFRDSIFELRNLNAEVIGISIDDTGSHERFSAKHSLPFPLLSDPGGKVAERYGSIFSLGPIRIAKRHTFIIDPDRKIAKVYRKVRAGEHSTQVLEDIKRLQASQ